MPTFSFVSDYTPTKSTKPQVTTVKFGDGYEQRYAKGLNTTPQNWSLTFNQRELAEANNIETFLLARAGVENFDWIPPDAVDPIKVKCSEWTKTLEVGNRWTLNMNFEEVFEP